MILVDGKLNANVQKEDEMKHAKTLSVLVALVIICLLMAARYYAGPVASESSLFAANPELMAARRYTGPVQSQSSLFAANPELMIVRRHYSSTSLQYTGVASSGSNQ
jgi:hypothetical protein